MAVWHKCVSGVVLGAALAEPAAAKALQTRAQFEQAATVEALEAVLQEADATARRARAALDGMRSGAGAGRAAADSVPRIVNGVLTAGFPTTVALLKGGDRESARSWCSGTIIGCSTVLTAAHCFDESSAPADFTMYSAHSGFSALAEVTVHPDYRPGRPAFDIAVVRLAAPVEGIVPIQLNTTGDIPLGTKGTIAGYGRSGGQRFDYGLKRIGAVQSTACRGDYADGTYVCWDFDTTVGLPGQDSNSCNADSGGPFFTAAGLTGVTDGGVLSSCLQGDHSYDANVFRYRDWIAKTAAESLASGLCGPLPEVDDLQAPVFGQSAMMTPDATKPFEFDVAPNTTRLRLAMNGHDDGQTDFNLTLFAPDGASPVCVANGIGQYAFCDIEVPAPGKWRAEVQDLRGEGLVQITVTTFLP